MRNRLLYLPIAVVTFVVALFLTPYNPVGGVRGVVYSVISATERNFGSFNRISSEYEGSWGGPGGDVIELKDNYITDVELGKSYQYRIVKRFHYRGQNQNGYLIQVNDLGLHSNLRKYVYLGFDDDRQLSYFGYDSLEDFDLGRASVSAGLSRHEFVE